MKWETTIFNRYDFMHKLLSQLHAIIEEIKAEKMTEINRNGNKAKKFIIDC